jgi:hypothetical protein
MYPLNADESDQGTQGEKMTKSDRALLILNDRFWPMHNLFSFSLFLFIRLNHV